MKSPNPETQCPKDIFQIQSPICSVYFSNNLSIPQIRVNKRETELDSTSRINSTIILKISSGFFSRMSTTMAGENFQIYTVQITGKWICETFPPSLHDLIIKSHVKQPLTRHKFAQKMFSPWKAFLREKRPPILSEGRRYYALSSYLFPFLKVSSLISVVQTKAFQSRTI